VGEQHCRRPGHSVLESEIVEQGSSALPSDREKCDQSPLGDRRAEHPASRLANSMIKRKGNRDVRLDEDRGRDGKILSLWLSAG
jgi:hypothetical protein